MTEGTEETEEGRKGRKGRGETHLPMEQNNSDNCTTIHREEVRIKNRRPKEFVNQIK
jgi:hypothetical protein